MWGVDAFMQLCKPMHFVKYRDRKFSERSLSTVRLVVAPKKDRHCCDITEMRFCIYYDLSRIVGHSYFYTPRKYFKVIIVCLQPFNTETQRFCGCGAVSLIVKSHYAVKHYLFGEGVVYQQ